MPRKDELSTLKNLKLDWEIILIQSNKSNKLSILNTNGLKNNKNVLIFYELFRSQDKSSH